MIKGIIINNYLQWFSIKRNLCFRLKLSINSWDITEMNTKRPRKSGFSMVISQGIGSTFISFLIIFQALQSEILRLDFYSLCSKILKIPEFTLVISKQSTCCKASKRCFKYSFDDKKFICGYKKSHPEFSRLFSRYVWT